MLTEYFNCSTIFSVNSKLELHRLFVFIRNEFWFCVISNKNLVSLFFFGLSFPYSNIDLNTSILPNTNTESWFPPPATQNCEKGWRFVVVAKKKVLFLLFCVFRLGDQRMLRLWVTIGIKKRKSYKSFRNIAINFNKKFSMSYAHGFLFLLILNWTNKRINEKQKKKKFPYETKKKRMKKKKLSWCRK